LRWFRGIFGILIIIIIIIIIILIIIILISISIIKYSPQAYKKKCGEQTLGAAAVAQVNHILSCSSPLSLSAF
jgi:uncharacterized membrane protein